MKIQTKNPLLNEKWKKMPKKRNFPQIKTNKLKLDITKQISNATLKSFRNRRLSEKEAFFRRALAQKLHYIKRI
jgi:hypothetical protein